jgi:hypothetical protein
VVASTHTHEAAISVQSPASVPHHLELSYVYEVDAVEMPGMESQVVPEGEPAVSISASRAETLDDEALPYEARPAAERESEVRSPKSDVQSTQSQVRSPEPEVQGAGPGAQHSPRQPTLFDGSDDRGH